MKSSVAVVQDGHDLYVRRSGKSFLKRESRRLSVGVSCDLALACFDLSIDSMQVICEPTSIEPSVHNYMQSMMRLLLTLSTHVC